MITLAIFNTQQYEPCIRWENLIRNNYEADETIILVFVDVIKNQWMTRAHQISNVPTTLIIYEGTIVNTIIGEIDKESLELCLSEYRKVQSDVFSESPAGSDGSRSLILHNSSK